MAVEDGQLAVRATEDQRPSGHVEQSFLGGDHGHREHAIGHQLPPPSRVRAFSSTDSAPPTFKKACSGTSSRSPLMRASKDSTVSATGTVTPFRPVKTSPT